MNDEISFLTLQSIRKTVPFYVFREFVKNSSRFDIHIDLENELNEITFETFETDFDFHQAIVSVFNQIEDGHTVYKAPVCYGNLVAEQPFTLISYDNVGKQVVAVSAVKTSLVGYLSRQDLSVDSYVGCQIVSIDGVEPVKYISNWTTHYLGGEKDAGTRFNEALRGSFMTRSLRYFNIPAKDMTYEFKCNGKKEKVVIPWVGYTLKDIDGEKDFGNDCLPGAEERQIERIEEDVETQGVEQVFQGDEVNYYELEGTVGVIQITSFSPKSDEQFVADFKKAMRTAKTNGKSKIIFDLSDNVGGDECLGYGMVKYLFEAAFNREDVTFVPRTNMIATELGRLLAEAGVGLPGDTASMWSPAMWTTLEGVTYTNASWYLDQKNITRNGFTTLYTPIVLENFCHDTFALFKVTPKDNLMSLNAFNSIVLTNGICLSTCALVAFHLQESKSIKTVVIGGLEGKEQQIASMPGGQVYDMMELVKDVNDLKLTDSSLAPQPFNHSASFTFTIREAYPWVQDSKNQDPMEFLFNAADFHTLYTKESASNRKQVWKDTQRYFNTCATWMECEFFSGMLLLALFIFALIVCVISIMSCYCFCKPSSERLQEIKYNLLSPHSRFESSDDEDV